MIYCTLIESLKPRKLHQRKNDNDYEIPDSVRWGVDDFGESSRRGAV
jgi:hypothetical protein